MYQNYCKKKKKSPYIINKKGGNFKTWLKKIKESFQIWNLWTHPQYHQSVELHQDNASNSTLQSTVKVKKKQKMSIKFITVTISAKSLNEFLHFWKVHNPNVDLQLFLNFGKQKTLLSKNYSVER